MAKIPSPQNRFQQTTKLHSPKYRFFYITSIHALAIRVLLRSFTLHRYPTGLQMIECVFLEFLQTQSLKKSAYNKRYSLCNV